MAILELCAGYGGLAMAVEAITGDRVSHLSEIDPGACAVLAKRFPDAVNIGDLTTFDWSELGEANIEVIAGGFPCQDISNAGLRKGITGERSGIWTHFSDAIGTLRPRFVFLENVSAIRRRGLDVVLRDLAGHGYDARWTNLRASDVGAPHKRDRWFLVAWPADSDSIGREGWTGDKPETGGWDESPDSGNSPAEWWGEYLPAIRRWEGLIGRAAPAPTEIGPRGGRRLTAVFTEWLMGVPAGHVTDVAGVAKPGKDPRATQIHIIGNGVVPQQAYAAYRWLLSQ